MNPIFVVGLTGPTGAGKSTVCRILQDSGISIIDADEIARAVTAKNTRGFTALVLNFGNEILTEDGDLDRRKLAQIAFSSKENTTLLNDITHPLITIEIRKIVRNLRQNNEKLAILDAPLLFESGINAMCHFTAAVTAPYELRLQRIVQRDGLDPELAAQRMSVQYLSEFYERRADYVIENNGSNEELLEKVRKFEIEIRRLANEARR